MSDIKAIKDLYSKVSSNVSSGSITTTRKLC